MILRFLHGWGFDAGVWNDLVPLLPPPWQRAIDDRGYFGTPKAIGAAGPNVVVAHSFGTLRALRALPAECRGLVAINGFDRFGAKGGSPGVSPRVLDAMIAKLDRSAEAVVADFRRRCGSPIPPCPVDPAPLREDLLALRDLDCSATLPDLPILALQGAADPILARPMREATFGSAAQVQRQEHPTAGHLLPISDPAYCAEAIRTFVERVG